MRVEFFLDIWNIFDAVTASQLRIFSCEAGKLVSETSPSGYCLVDRYRVERLGEKGGLQGVLWGLVVLYLNWEQALVAWCLWHGGCKDLMHAACCVRSMIGIFAILPLILCYYDNMLRARHGTRHSWNELKFVPNHHSKKASKEFKREFPKHGIRIKENVTSMFLLRNWGEAFGPLIPCCCA